MELEYGKPWRYCPPTPWIWSFHLSRCTEYTFPWAPSIRWPVTRAHGTMRTTVT